MQVPGSENHRPSLKHHLLFTAPNPEGQNK